MLFNGFMSAMNKSMSITPTKINLTSISITDGIYDFLGLYNTPREIGTVSDEWTSDTVLVADFKNTLSAGNFDGTVSETSALRIKRKKHSDLSSSWITIYEKSVNSEDDFNFSYFDKTAKAKTEYDYGIVPVYKNGTEGVLAVTSVYSDFDGVVICDAEHTYNTELEVSYTNKKNHSESVVSTLSGKYPYVVRNSKSDYYTGSIEALFAKFEDCKYMYEQSYEYRFELMDFLNSQECKIIKFDDGRMWLCEITGSPSESNSEHSLKVITSFEWTEIGDCENAIDLYNSGFINKNPADYSTSTLPIPYIPPQPIPPVEDMRGYTKEVALDNYNAYFTTIQLSTYETK